MLRVAEQYAATDTGRQRRANEDALLSRSPLFVVADGMGGAQAGEVASQIAVEAFKRGLRNSLEPEAALAELTREANARIHELSHSHTEQAGMGTTLTAMYVGEQDVAIAHVGDSRAYCLRDGELIRLTDDHSLVDELMRQGRLTPETKSLLYRGRLPGSLKGTPRYSVIRPRALVPMKYTDCRATYAPAPTSASTASNATSAPARRTPRRRRALPRARGWGRRGCRRGTGAGTAGAPTIVTSIGAAPSGPLE